MLCVFAAGSVEMRRQGEAAQAQAKRGDAILRE